MFRIWSRWDRSCSAGFGGSATAVSKWLPQSVLSKPRALGLRNEDGENMQMPKVTFWKVVLVAILIPGLYSLLFRLTHGLGASTNLNDEFPWGLWVGFKLFSVALAGGGFTLAAVVYIFNLQRYRPVLRPMILTAFLG